MVIDACPAFTASAYQNWQREVKIWISRQPGDTVTHLMARLIQVPPLDVETEALRHMARTENAP